MRNGWKLAAAATAAAVVVVAHTIREPDSPAPVTPTIPGAVNPEVTQRTIYRTICVHGWTATVRPPYSYTRRIKVSQVGEENTTRYEEDHLIPLELGGSPASLKNLWAEPWAEAHRSDPLENRLKAQVCNGEITLKQGRRKIRDFKRRYG